MCNARPCYFTSPPQKAILDLYIGNIYELGTINETDKALIWHPDVWLRIERLMFEMSGIRNNQGHTLCRVRHENCASVP
jgi:hypothetical protein